MEVTRKKASIYWIDGRFYCLFWKQTNFQWKFNSSNRMGLHTRN